MTRPRASLRSLALACVALLATSAPAPRAGSAAELVIGLAPPRPGAAAEAAGRLPARLAALRLSLRTTLAAATPEAPAGAPARLSPGRGPRDLDPGRVWLVEAPDSASAAAALDALRRDPAVAWAEPNRVREVAGAVDGTFPDDPLFRDGRQWGLRNLGPGGPYGGLAGADVRASEAWARTTGSNQLLLAVADTGIDPDHPDLQAKLPGGRLRIAFGVNVCGEPAAAFADSYGHGTPVAGVMAARTNDGIHFDSLGAAGVCGGDGRDGYGCRIVPIKIAPRHSGSATSFAIASAALYATRVGARAMNLSFAGGGASRVEREALAWAVAHGCVVVAAAGNHGDGLAMYPAAYAVDGLCIQVGASDAYDRRTAWSSCGPGLDLLAPGADIWTTFMTYPSSAGAVYPGYVRAAGTSYAAPFVTGTVGLLAAARPELTDTDFQHLVRESARDLGDPGPDSLTGWGRLDAAAALDLAGPGVGVWHDEVAAQDLRLLGVDTLVVAEGGFGTLDLWSGRRLAERYEVTARVSLPDSFLGPVRAWPRVAGTTTMRGGFRLPWFAPWAEVAEWRAPGTSLPGGARAFTLRGYLYRVLEGGDAETAWVPLPPDQARFGFTVIGPVDRPPALAVLAPAAGDTLAAGGSAIVRWRAFDLDRVDEVAVELLQSGRPPQLLARSGAAEGEARVAIACAIRPGLARLRVTALDRHGAQRDETSLEVPLRIRPGPCTREAAGIFAIAPNPFRGATRIAGAPGARVAIFDLAGRRLREAMLDRRGGFTWDGRDESGRRVGPGVYLVRGAEAGTERKLVRVE